MKRIRTLAIGLVCSSLPFAAQAVTDHELALHHAPVHYQDTDDTDYKSDYITAIDYDGDWAGTNNWDNLGNGLWPATAYYSVQESCTHYYITYAFFHPRDWADVWFDQEHENDLEGALFIVRKDGSTYGTFEGMVTVFHTDFYSYTPSGSPLTGGEEDIDGTVSFESFNGVARPKTTQEAKGHGLKAWPYAGDFDGSSDQDGVIYYPVDGASDYPSSGNDRYVEYRLVNMTAPGSLWDRAMTEADSPDITFHSWGTFKGDSSGGCGDGWQTCSDNSANTPWGWDDGDDGAVYRGELGLDPAKLTGHYFDGLGTFSYDYPSNRYAENLRDAGYTNSNPPHGFPDKVDLDALYDHLVLSCE